MESTTNANSTEQSKSKTSKKPWLVGGGVVVAIIVAVVAIITVVHGTKGSNVKKDPNFVASANASAISGLAIKSANVSQYSRQDETSAQIAQAQKQQNSEGLADFYTIEGGVQYTVGSSDAGNVVEIQWGSLGKNWNFDNYMSTLEASTQKAAGGDTSVQFSTVKDGQIKVSASDGKKYAVPCLDLNESSSDGSPATSIFSCDGPMGSSQRYLSVTTSTGDNQLASGKALIQKFISSVTVELK